MGMSGDFLHLIAYSIEPMPRAHSAKPNEHQSLYPDNGCEHSPSCLQCPLEKCVHDELRPGGVPRLKLKARRRKIASLTARGVSVKQIASRLGVSLNTVYSYQSKIARVPSGVV